MCIRTALLSDLDTVLNITQETVRCIYPHYYPRGAVDFFLQHHNAESIIADIKDCLVFLCLASDQTAVGTVTVRKNELCRLFVLPQYQGHGYGRMLLDFAEAKVSETHNTIVLDASLPAKSIYIRRGYHITESHAIPTSFGDFLCYDVMQKPFTDKTSF